MRPGTRNYQEPHLLRPLYLNYPVSPVKYSVIEQILVTLVYSHFHPIFFDGDLKVTEVQWKMTSEDILTIIFGIVASVLALITILQAYLKGRAPRGRYPGVAQDWLMEEF